jgi:5-formyltetrahydrofolate cyclo-ligase
MSLTKAQLRAEIKTALSKLSDEAILKKTFEINLQLQKLIQKKQLVGAYAPLVGEPQWPICNGHESWAFPAVYKTEMVFKKCTYQELVEEKVVGLAIRAPAVDASIVVPQVLIIPGLAFSLSGERLGRGRGYYDRYLEHFTGLRIGVCFEEQLLAKIPSEDHDAKMHLIVTEKRVVKIEEKL